MYIGDPNRSLIDKRQKISYVPMRADVVHHVQKDAVEGSISVIGERHTDKIEQKAYSSLASTIDTAPVRRLPIVIPGTNGKQVGNGGCGHERRMMVQIGLTVMFIGLICSIVFVILSTGSGIDNALYILGEPTFHKVTLAGMNPSLIVSQRATATAITQDGYEYHGAGGKYRWAGVRRNFLLPDGRTTGSPDVPVTVPPVSVPDTASTTTQNSSRATTAGVSSDSGRIADYSFINPFTPGQCTYWADYEYHRLTGYVIPWSGDAADWASNASSYGWIVSTVPKINSVIVLRPGVQGAGWAGHVAVVEKVNADGSVMTTNWNVLGWGIFSWRTYYPGQGVSFIWHP